MTLFQETTAAGERGAGAPGGAQRHLPPPAAPAALAPPRKAAPPSMRSLWPPRYKGAAVRASARVGRQLTERKPPFTRPPARPLLCFATLQPGTAGGRARHTSGRPRDAERRADRGSLSYPLLPAPSEDTQVSHRPLGTSGAT